MTIVKKTTELAGLMSLPAFDGNISILSASGLFTIAAAPTLALSLIVGPSSLLSAISIPGTMKERIVASLVAGLVATTIIVIAATLGAKLTEFVNFDVLRIVGGLAVIIIGGLLMGFKIPTKLPLIVMIVGVVLSVIWR